MKISSVRGALGVAMFAAALCSCAQKPVAEEPAAPDRQLIEEVARDHNHEVLLCYQTALKTKPKLRGDLTLSLDAAEDGHVSEVRIAQGLDPDLDRCVTDKARGWKFPWIKTATAAIEDAYHLSLGKDGQPVSEFESPSDARPGIRRVFRQHLRPIRACYEARLKDKPDLEGKLVMAWTLDEKGNVASMKASQPLDSVVDNCIMDLVKSFKFSPPAKDKVVSVTYPLFFAPR